MFEFLCALALALFAFVLGLLAARVRRRLRRQYAPPLDVGMLVGPVCQRQKASAAINAKGKPYTSNLDADDAASCIKATVDELRAVNRKNPGGVDNLLCVPRGFPVKARKP